MTKMNGNIPDVTNENLSVEEMFNDNIIVKRKKNNFDDYIENINTELNKYHNNNNIKLIDKTNDGSKRKTKDKRIGIDTDYTKTVRLELREDNCIIEYKMNDELNKNGTNDINEVLLENGGLHEYTLKDSELRLDSPKSVNNEVLEHDGEFVNGHTEGDKVGITIYKSFP